MAFGGDLVTDAYRVGYKALLHFTSLTSPRKDFIMKKLIALSLSVFSLAACGSSTPQTSDVKTFLQTRFQSCKNIKVVDIKKTNGYQHPSMTNAYVVEYAYTIAMKNPSEYKALAGIYEKEQKTLRSFNAALDELLTSSSRALEEKRNQDFAAAQRQGHEIEQRRDQFLQNATLVGNVPVKISNYYFLDCGENNVKNLTPSRHLLKGLYLNLGFAQDSPEWFTIPDIDMTGEVTLRKTDNGWRSL